MRAVVRAQYQAVSIGVHNLANDFDRVLQDLEVVYFRAYEKGLLSDAEQAAFIANVEKIRPELMQFWQEEQAEPAHSHAGRYA